MTRIDRTRRVAPARADTFAEVGRRLLSAGRAIQEQDDPRHASALAILAVHAVIAQADAVCVHGGGRKSVSSDHEAALRLLRGILGTHLPDAMAKAFARVVSEKDRFEYQGYVVTMAEAAAVFKLADRFGAWAERVLAGAE